ncbi:MAG: hypothetical protein ACXQTS_05375 [Candidatus Methanospirareceae archaeon]
MIVLRCSKCKNDLEGCDWCGEKFEKGMDIKCYDVGTAYLHFCCEECLYEYVEYYVSNAKCVRDEDLE